MKRIILAVTNDLTTDQRVDRTCRALTEEGWEVTLVGRKLRNSLPLESRPYSTHRMRLVFRRSALFYAEYNLRLFLLMLFRKADCLFANDTDTLAACCLASRILRKPLVFDAHELFPEVPELAGRPRVKAVWEWVERVSLPYAKCCFTVCQSVADEYRRRYGVEMTVVRNVPDRPAQPPQEPSDAGRQPILLYQGAVNIGRGIHELVDAMGHLPACRLVVAGDGDLLEEMKAYAADKPWRDRVMFLGRLMPDELVRLTPRADVGLVMLEDMGLNYHYALPNRIGDFVQAGVPIVVSDLPEMAAVVRKFKVGEVIEMKNEELGVRNCYAKALARAVQMVLAKGRGGYDFSEARSDMDWNKEKNKLLECVYA